MEFWLVLDHLGCSTQLSGVQFRLLTCVEKKKSSLPPLSSSSPPQLGVDWYSSVSAIGLHGKEEVFPPSPPKKKTDHPSVPTSPVYIQSLLNHKDPLAPNPGRCLSVGFPSPSPSIPSFSPLFPPPFSIATQAGYAKFLFGLVRLAIQLLTRHSPGRWGTLPLLPFSPFYFVRFVSSCRTSPQDPQGPLNVINKK